MFKLVLSVFTRYRNLLLYAAIGISALLAELVIFYLLTKVAGMNIPVSNALAMIVGFFMSFFLNALYNFQVRNNLLSRLVRFGIVTFGGYLLSTAIILLLVEVAGVPVFYAKLISVPFFFAFQYTLNSRFTFKASNVAQPDTAPKDTDSTVL